MTTRRHKEPPDLRANLTPMIDIVFQLIIFFMVVAQITRHRAVELTPPMIDAGASRDDADDNTPPIVIHVIPGATAPGAPAYRLNDEFFEDHDSGLAALARRVGECIARAPDARVQVRADRLEDYARVRPALQAANEGGATSVGLVTTTPGDAGPEPAP